MKHFTTVAAAIGFAVVALPATAQFAKPEDAIKYRQSALFVMQQNFARLGWNGAGKDSL